MSFLRGTSVDAIVATFTKTISKLEKHADEQGAAIVLHEQTIATATAAKEAASKEQSKALSVAAKIRSLLS